MKQQSLQHVSRESVTSNQLHNLLNAFSVASSFLLHARDSQLEQPHHGPIDGGALSAVETTLIGVCSRIDSLLADTARWSLDSQKTLEESLCEAYKANAEASRAQAAAYAETTSPHARYKPTLVKIGNGDWVAIVGDINDIDNALVGLGGNPAEAISAFDAIFAGEVPEHLKKLLQQYEKQLDEKASGATEDPSNGGQNLPGDCEDSGPDPESGRASGGEEPPPRG